MLVERKRLSGETVAASADQGYDYDLGAEDMLQLESEIADEVRTMHGETLAAVWIPSYSQYASVLRTHEVTVENGYFKEIPTVMEAYEKECEFLAFVDTRESRNDGERIVHGFRISSPGLTTAERVGTPEEGKANIAFIQDLIRGGEVTEEEIASYYQDIGVDLNACISVETNFKIGRPAERVNGMKAGELGYLALFNAVVAGSKNPAQAGVFAHLNRPAKFSLGRTGVSYVPVAGRPELRTPTMNPDKPGVIEFDDHYNPVFIPVAGNEAVFEALTPYSPPVVSFRK